MHLNLVTNIKGGGVDGSRGNVSENDNDGLKPVGCQGKYFVAAVKEAVTAELENTRLKFRVYKMHRCILNPLSLIYTKSNTFSSANN